MEKDNPFFTEPLTGGTWHVDGPTEAMIKHEVFFEKSLTSIQHRPLYLGKAFPMRRFLVAGIVAGCLIGSLIARAVYMQIVEGSSYRERAENNRLRHTLVLPRRGLIRDRQGRILAENIPRFQVTVLPRDLAPSTDERSLELGEAARLLGTSIGALSAMIPTTGTGRDETLLVSDRVAYDDAMRFALALPHLPGFELEVNPRRKYPMSASVPSLSHLLGYVGKLSPEEYETRRDQGYRRADEIGKTGLERSYEAELRGTVGEKISEVDARGRVKAFVGDRPAVDGKDVTLSVDLDLQRLAEKTLADEMRLVGVKRGAAIALDPRDGSILAAVSLPAYDNNIFSGGASSTVYQTLIRNPDQPLFARAWSGTYPSGSTVKIVISAAALAERIITPQTIVMSTGGLKIGPWFFPDWKAGGHGATNVRKAIAWSVNTFYYTIGGGYESFVGLGVDRLSMWMKKFGLGAKSGLDITNEATGFVPSKEWKEEVKKAHWFVGDTYNLSIGQGDLLVTPVQVAVYTAAIANGGTLVSPHFAGGSHVFPARATALADASTIGTVREGMRDCVQFGSCRALNDLSFATAGKTGTAQWSSDKKTHAWFTAFAPFEKPEIAVTVLLEEGGEGSSVSVPVTKKILQDWWDLRAARGGKF